VFKAVLVYDVSRWGRFQDTDESAHYEFLCKRAGVPIYYCAESCKNNSSSPAVIMKTLKRVMAAEYSRDLSQRLSRTKKILTQRGYRAGGIAGYGLRRMLVSFDGSPKQVLRRGEVKKLCDWAGHSSTWSAQRSCSCSRHLSSQNFREEKCESHCT